MYTNLDDYPELFRMQDQVTLPVKHILTIEEQLSNGSKIATLNADIEIVESAKKQIAKEYQNKIDNMKAEVKLYSGQLNNGFKFIDRLCDMHLDYEAKKRVYFDKQNGNFVKEEDFHPSDFIKRQTALDLEAKLTQEDIERQKQIEANNHAGDYAEGDPFKPVDDVIIDKKLGKGKLKKVDDDIPEGMYVGSDGNLTDIAPANDADGTFRDQHGNITAFDDELPI